MYGKGQSTKSLLSQLQQAIDNNGEIFNMSGGEQNRDYLPVERVAEYIVDKVILTRATGIINCCSSTPINLKQCVLDRIVKNKAVIKLNLGYCPYPDYERMHFWGDNRRLIQTII